MESLESRKSKDIKINVIFYEGDFVYIITDPEQKKRQVIGFTKYCNNAVYYIVAFGEEEPKECQSCELSLQRDTELVAISKLKDE